MIRNVFRIRCESFFYAFAGAMIVMGILLFFSAFTKNNLRDC